MFQKIHVSTLEVGVHKSCGVFLWDSQDMYKKPVPQNYI